VDRPGALNLNPRAAAIADAMAADAALLRVAASRLDGGARFLDCGIEARGGLEAGRLLAEACLGGAGRVAFASLDVGGLRLPGVTVTTDHPALACLASQYAGWAIKPEGFFAMGSGPLRAIARVEEELYARLGYAEPADGPGVLVLETRSKPDGAVAAWVERKSGVAAERLTLLAAPTASFAGGVQISARVVETALHKLLELGFDVARVVTGFGSAPLAPIAKSDVRAIGRTNDCILYGGAVHLTVDAEDEELSGIAPQVPSSSSRDYGTPFYDLFKRYGGDFYKVDPHLFSPALVSLTSLRSGHSFEAGRLNADVLRRSLFA
jgi:methenyltetrahydromethanopterin cyclohydrolase